MAFLAKNINLDMTDEMVMLATLYLIENFKPCNKHLCLLARYLGFMTWKVQIIDFKS